MNGVVSSSMRKKGVCYNLNFGVSLPKIKEIALSYPKDAELAEALWKEDVRELKILATLLQPAENFTKQQAWNWAKDVKHQEIAEQYCHNLLQELHFAEDLACEWILNDEVYVPVIGFLLLGKLCGKNVCLSSSHAEILMREARKTMDKGVSRLQRAAVVALKRYGRQQPENAKKVLDSIGDYPLSDSLEKQEFFNDIKFDFDYYL